MKLFLALALVFAVNVNAATMKIDTQASTIGWKGSKKIGNDSHHGNVAVKEGQVETNDKGEITGGNLVADMKKITCADLASDKKSHDKLVGHLSSADFFDVAKYPTTTFKVTSVSKKGNDTVIKGDLTMLGKTNPVEFPAKVTTDANGATAEGKLKIDRTQWGLIYGSGNFFKELTANKIINNEIEFDLKIVAKK